ncbi:MAG: heme-binding protein [Actinomycetota bacterium]|nr:heme-binding protein [Actinomycetota bacterium]
MRGGASSRTNPRSSTASPTPPRLIVFGGGVPITSNGELVGTIGVSGRSAEEDTIVASAGAAVLA